MASLLAGVGQLSQLAKLWFGCCSALKDMSASEQHFTSIQELMKNAVFMKQQIHYKTFRRCRHGTALTSLCHSACLSAWLPWPLSLSPFLSLFPILLLLLIIYYYYHHFVAIIQN